jgi:hypothetical protein
MQLIIFPKIVCSVGFEPNLHHTKVLSELEAAHRKCGWKTKFFTETAVAHDYGVIDVFAESNHDDHKKELGASIIGEKKNYDIVKVSSYLIIFCMT